MSRAAMAAGAELSARADAALPTALRAALRAARKFEAREADRDELTAGAAWLALQHHHGSCARADTYLRSAAKRWRQAPCAPREFGGDRDSEAAPARDLVSQGLDPLGLLLRSEAEIEEGDAFVPAMVAAAVALLEAEQAAAVPPPRRGRPTRHEVIARGGQKTLPGLSDPPRTKPHATHATRRGDRAPLDPAELAPAPQEQLDLWERP